MNTSTTKVLVKKRERTQNWVPEEKYALFALIKIHVNAIENKKIDAAASAMKTLAWKQIYLNFRGRFSTERDITRMREQWRRMKAQARIEMYTFAEKVRTLGPEEASKNRPSNLSIEVWRLMENFRKTNGEGEVISDASISDQDVDQHEASDSAGSLPTTLDGPAIASTSEISVHDVKIEKIRNDEYHEDDNFFANQPCRNLAMSERSLLRRQKRTCELEQISGNNRKKSKVQGETFSGNFETCDGSREIVNDVSEPVLQIPEAEDPQLQSEAVRNVIWVFEAAQKEHNIKLKMLNTELEKAELEKQTALNDLKTSEMKKQLVWKQATEFIHSQVRMSGEPGSGAGKGGGGGGSIREAGGAFGKMEAAREDQYFYNQQKEQLSQLRESLHDEISFHEEQIKRHQEAIARHKSRIGKMEEK